MVVKEPIVQCLGFQNEHYLIKISFPVENENGRFGVILEIKPEDCFYTSMDGELIHKKLSLK